MKYSLIIIHLIINSLITMQAQIVNIPDPVFKNYLLGQPGINTNGDGEIQNSEASAFNGTIIANGMGISDLTGIEAFTAITGLECYNNLLTDLYINNGFNTNISYFNTRYNSGLTYIHVDNALWSTANWTEIDSCTSFIDVGIYPARYKINEFQIWPNPAQDIVFFESWNMAETGLFIYNMQGNQVLGTSFAGKTNVNIKSWPAGVYCIRFISGNEVMITNFIKE